MQKLTIIPLDTPGKKAKGLQHMKPIPEKTLWSFPDIREGQVFHSQNVLEPFDIAFIDGDGKILLVETIIPQKAVIAAPKGAAIAIEAKEGELARIGFAEGNRINTAVLTAKNEGSNEGPKGEKRGV